MCVCPIFQKKPSLFFEVWTNFHITSTMMPLNIIVSNCNHLAMLTTALGCSRALRGLGGHFGNHFWVPHYLRGIAYPLLRPTSLLWSLWFQGLGFSHLWFSYGFPDVLPCFLRLLGCFGCSLKQRYGGLPPTCGPPTAEAEPRGDKTVLGWIGWMLPSNKLTYRIWYTIGKP